MGRYEILISTLAGLDFMAWMPMAANVPNTVGSITSLVAAYDINIDNMVNKSRGQFAYTVLDLDEAPPEILLDKIENLEAIYRVRSF